MTLDEFKNTSWGYGMIVRYHGDGLEHPVASVDFAEMLVGITEVISNEPDAISWVRCENVTVTGGIPIPEDESKRDLPEG